MPGPTSTMDIGSDGVAVIRLQNPPVNALHPDGVLLLCFSAERHCRSVAPLYIGAWSPYMHVGHVWPPRPLPHPTPLYRDALLDPHTTANSTSGFTLPAWLPPACRYHSRSPSLAFSRIERPFQIGDLISLVDTSACRSQC